MAVRKVLIFIALVIVLVAGPAAVVAWRGWNDMHEPYKGYDGPEQFVTIRQGAASGEIGRALADAHIVSEARLFRAALWWTRQGRNLKAGEYRFDHAVTPLDVSLTVTVCVPAVLRIVLPKVCVPASPAVNV